MEGVVAGDATELLLDLRFPSASRRASSKLCVELERDVATFVCNEEIRIFLWRGKLKKSMYSILLLSTTRHFVTNC